MLCIFFEYFLGLIPAAVFDCLTCYAHQSKCTLSILEEFGYFHLAGFGAV